jgi:acetylornithine deacetylase
MNPGINTQRARLWELATKLISFDSVSAKSNRELVLYLADILDAARAETHIVTDNVQGVEKLSLLAILGPLDAEGFCLSGHTDVVPFEGQAGWKSNPLELKFNSGQAIGRGITDMKGFLAQCAALFESIHRKNLRRNISLLFTSDEEVGAAGSKRLVERFSRSLPPFPFPRFAIIGEPTSLDIFRAHKSYGAAFFEVCTKGGHSSRPDAGLNAILMAKEFLEILKSKNGELLETTGKESYDLFPDFPHASINIGTIGGGIADNMIADACHVTFSMRLLAGLCWDRLLIDLNEAFIERLRELHLIECVSFTLESISNVDPLNSPTNSPLLAALCRASGCNIADVCGAPYATDGGNLKKLGIDSYIWGPGVLSEAHQPNESIPIENMHRGFDILERLVTDYCC